MGAVIVFGVADLDGVVAVVLFIVTAVLLVEVVVFGVAEENVVVAGVVLLVVIADVVLGVAEENIVVAVVVLLIVAATVLLVVVVADDEDAVVAITFAVGLFVDFCAVPCVIIVIVDLSGGALPSCFAAEIVKEFDGNPAVGIEESVAPGSFCSLPVLC